MSLDVRRWLGEDVLPLWLDRGIDRERGGFVEGLSLDGKPLDIPRRAMVQARQIYSLRVAAKLGSCESQMARKAIEGGARLLLERFSLPSGAFVHSIDAKGHPHRTEPDLYAQAFALFGLAHAYSVLKDDLLRARAEVLIQYLRRERRLSGGGYSELQEGKILHEANPHMHLFEAALAWMEVDGGSLWRELADEMLELCRSKFVDRETGALCEHFDSSWKPLLEGGRFVFEPGHHYEWSWLMGRYEKLTGISLQGLRIGLFEIAEKSGIDPSRGAVMDEVWSDLTPRTRSSRFWPQCERIKAAVSLGKRESAEEAPGVLVKYFETPKRGLWFDRWMEDGRFKQEAAKASSLYHIIGALDAYLEAYSA